MFQYIVNKIVPFIAHIVCCIKQLRHHLFYNCIVKKVMLFNWQFIGGNNSGTVISISKIFNIITLMKISILIIQITM